MKFKFSIILFLLLFSCEEDVNFDSSFYHNTQKTIFNKECVPLSNNGRIWSYQIAENKWIYKCSATSLFYAIDEKDSIINKVNYPNRIESDWITNYKGSSLIAITESNNTSELIKLDIENDSIISKVQIPFGAFRTSEHPISHNEIFTYLVNGNVCLYNFQNESLSINVVKSSVPPIISKNGKYILLIRNKELIKYDIKSKTEKLIYDLNEERNFNPFRVFFGKEDEYIVKGSISYPLENVEFLVIRKENKIRIKDLKILRGFQYK